MSGLPIKWKNRSVKLSPKNERRVRSMLKRMGKGIPEDEPVLNRHLYWLQEAGFDEEDFMSYGEM